MKQRLKKVLIVLAALAAAGLVYTYLSGFGISLPCVFHELTGLYCPGCGSTRMFRRLLYLDLYGAFRANPAMLCILPFAAAAAAILLYRYIRFGSKGNIKRLTAFLCIAAAALLVFGIMRNIQGFEYLQPRWR